MKTVRPFATALGARGEIVCDAPGDWSFTVTSTVDDGRDAVTVHLRSATEALPPHFGVFLVSSGAGVQNVWISNCGTTGDACHLWPKLWCHGKTLNRSSLANETPIAVGFNSAGVAPVATACSEAFEPTKWGLYADERTCEVTARFEFFEKPVRKMKDYTVTVLLDRRGRPFAETVRACTDWIVRRNGFTPAAVPEAAFDPLYSTWYAYLQDVSDRPLEEEARLAASLGMKTMILDDGWQKVDSVGFYSATGDWMPVPSRFPDMKGHVAKVHAAGLKYMLWLAVPFVGDESKVWTQFEKKLLSGGDGKSPGRTGILDPRFPEVREYLIQTYERVVGDWGFDGVKLDFIDSFRIPASGDPALKDNYAGRDYRSLSEAVNRLMKDVLARLRKINPDVLVEFRQHYMGPSILQYGNMMRAADCPVDPTANRRRICDLRLTSGAMAVHSDMLVWSKDETPEGAALPILNALYSTIQYSMVLATIAPSHRDVIRRWLRFSQDHREALLKGSFTPLHPENGYTAIVGESAAERVITAYSDNVCVDCGAVDKPVLVVNATGRKGVLVSLAATPKAVRAFDVLGNEVPVDIPSAGLSRVDVPASGHLEIVWNTAEELDSTACAPVPEQVSLGELKWTLPEFARIEGSRLVVDIPASKRTRSSVVRAELDVKPYAGHTLRFEISTTAKDVAKPERPYWGSKFQLAVEYADGTREWPSARGGEGSWSSVQTFRALLRRQAVKRASLELGIQSSTGRMEYDLSSLKIWDDGELFKLVNQDFQVRYPESVARRRPLRGVMLPGSASEITEDHFISLEEWGATLVRFQFSHGWDRVGAWLDCSAYDRYVDGELDALEKRILPWAGKHGIKVCIDLHAVPGARIAPGTELRMFFEKKYRDHFVATWRRIAARLKEDPRLYGYDLVNEPCQTSSAPYSYLHVQLDAARAIREVDAKTPIIVEANEYDSPMAFGYLSPLAMDNVIYEVHSYLPMSFTHQNIGPRKSITLKRYPNEAEGWNKDFIRKALEPVRQFALRHRAKIYVGEFSAVIWAPGAEDYIRDSIDIFNEYGWDWSYHAFREWNGWSVEHTWSRDADGREKFAPSSDNPRLRALKEGLRR